MTANKAPLGPLDSRRLVRRCDSCAKRKTKCHGGLPCIPCLRRQVPCRLQTRPVESEPVFIIRCAGRDRENNIPSASGSPSLPRLREPDAQGRYITYFFSTYLLLHRFHPADDGIDNASLLALCHGYPMVRNAIIAVAALESGLKYKDNCGFAQEHVTPATIATQAYLDSVRLLRSQITDHQVIKRDEVLWTTFLLGLFELMNDHTGLKWLSHLLSGTSALLQLRGPGECVSGAGHAFYRMARIFEITRSLLFGGGTFLARPEWANTIRGSCHDEEGKMALDQESESIYHLLVQASDLGNRVTCFLYPVRPTSLVDGNVHPFCVNLTTASGLIKQGTGLHSSLRAWRSKHNLSTSALDPVSDDLLIALLHYHAVSIYLDGLFSHHSQHPLLAPLLSASSDAQLNVPSLLPAQIEMHVQNILVFSMQLLQTQRLAALLILFPLRVAGARATQQGQRRKISELLEEVGTRGWAVARAFTEELYMYWKR